MTRPRSYKRARSPFKQEPDIDIRRHTAQVYEFVDQTAEMWDQKKHKTSKISSSTPLLTLRSKPPSTAPSTLSTPLSTPPLADSRRSTPWTELALEDSESETCIPVQPAPEGIAKNIDPRLLSQSAIAPIGDYMTSPSPCQSSMIDLSGSSPVIGPRKACTVAPDCDMTKVADLANPGEEKSQVSEPASRPDIAANRSMC
jgi:hypothetical protein